MLEVVEELLQSFTRAWNGNCGGGVSSRNTGEECFCAISLSTRFDYDDSNPWRKGTDEAGVPGPGNGSWICWHQI